MEIIDAWAQQPNEAFLSQPMFDSLRRWQPDAASSTTLRPEALLEDMDRAGVSQAMLCAWWAPNGPIITNDEVGTMCDAHPDRFIGVASVDLHQPMRAVEELRRSHERYGVKALRLLPWLWGLPPDDRRYYPLYAACCDLDLTFCTQVGHAGPLRPSEPGRPIPYLDHVALEFPDLRIVGGHIGEPWLDEMLSLTNKYPNVYIDTSAYKAGRYPDKLVTHLKTRRAHKILFGSNYPFWPATDCLADLDTLGLDDPTKQAFLHDNARVAFNLQP